MPLPIRRPLIAACGAVLLLVAAPAECQACWFTHWLHGHGARRPVYRPVQAYQPIVTDPCGVPTCQPTVVQYVPHRAYRTTWVNVPVTSYRPVWTHRQVMRPCTSYMWQARRAAYQTYRPVYSTMNYGTANYGAAYSVGACGSCTGLGCASCAPAAPLSSRPADQRPSLAPRSSVPNQSQGSSFRRIAPPNQQPTVGPPNNSRLKPIPSSDPHAGRGNLHQEPRLLDPRDTTAARPLRPSWATSPIGWPAVSQPIHTASAIGAVQEDVLDDGGWRPSSR